MVLDITPNTKFVYSLKDWIIEYPIFFVCICIKFFLDNMFLFYRHISHFVSVNATFAYFCIVS